MKTAKKKDIVWNSKKAEGLAAAIASLRNGKETKRFLRDLLTADEIKEFSNRWLAAQMLSKNVSYTAIRGKTGLSSATIARISDWLQNGCGGYRLMLNRAANHHHNSSSVGKGLC